MSQLEDLPREILSLICSLLKQTAKFNCIFVNKEFHDAAIPELWREPVLSSTASLQKLIRCLKLAKHQWGEYIRTLSLGVKLTVHDEDLIHLMRSTPSLEVLELKKAEEVTDESIQLVSRYCKQLRSFYIKSSPITYRSAHYLGRCKQLQRLTLASCPNLLSMTLLPFVELPIEYLDLAGCKWLDAEDTARDICSLFYLTHLNLVCCRQISMDFISQFTSKEGGQPYLPYLQEFSISGSALIGDHVMIPFIKQYRTLKRLYLFECDISDQSLSAISTYLPHIQCLDLSFSLGVTSKGLRSLVVSCVDLVLLGLKNCNIALRDFPEIVLSSSMPVHSPHLDILYLHELGIIRAQSSNPTKELEWDQEEQQQQELSDEEQQQQEEEEEEDHTAVDDSVSESYNFIQQYLNSVSP